MITVAVLLPTKGRASQMVAYVADLLTQEPPDDVKIMVVLSVIFNDNETVRSVYNLMKIKWAERVELHMVTRGKEDSTAVEGWNTAYRYAHVRGADWYVLGADDIRWHPGWLKEALAVVTDGVEVVGLNDGHTNLHDYAPHYMASNRFTVDILDGVMVPNVYTSWWFDREVCQRARGLGMYAPAWDAWCEHRHPNWKTASTDTTYLDAWATHDMDRVVYTERMKVTV